MHEYHFKLDIPTKNTLSVISNRLGGKSISGLITKICKKLIKYIKRTQLIPPRENCRFSKIVEDPDILIKSIHVYMPQKLYFRLKNLHAKYNYFSIAQIVRLLIRGYIFLDNKYGDKLNEILFSWSQCNYIKNSVMNLKIKLRLFASSISGHNNIIINFAKYFDNR